MANGSSLEVSHIREEEYFCMGIVQRYDSIGWLPVNNFSCELGSGDACIFRERRCISCEAAVAGKEQKENEHVTAWAFHDYYHYRFW